MFEIVMIVTTISVCMFVLTVQGRCSHVQPARTEIHGSRTQVPIIGMFYV